MIRVNPDNLPYRPSVGVSLFNKDGHVLIGQRIGDQGFWQMPQTGIRHNETVIAAARREIQESLHISNFRMLAMTTDWLRCDLPSYLLGRVMNGRYRGDEQKWVAARFLDKNDDLLHESMKREFTAWRWESLDTLPGVVAPYKRSTYRSVAEAFKQFSSPISSQQTSAQTGPKEKEENSSSRKESAEVIRFERTLSAVR